MTSRIKIPEIDMLKVRRVFESTAQATGPDFLQIAIDNGLKPVVRREDLFDYLEMYGGEHKDEVLKWINEYPGDFKSLNRYLTKRGIPKTWA